MSARSRRANGHLDQDIARHPGGLRVRLHADIRFGPIKDELARRRRRLAGDQQPEHQDDRRGLPLDAQGAGRAIAIATKPLYIVTGKQCTTYGLPRRRLMRFVNKLLANLTDAKAGDLDDRIINILTRIAPSV